MLAAKTPPDAWAWPESSKHRAIALTYLIQTSPEKFSGVFISIQLPISGAVSTGGCSTLVFKFEDGVLEIKQRQRVSSRTEVCFVKRR